MQQLSSSRHLLLAKNMLEVTYPLVNEPKLYKVALHHICQGVFLSMFQLTLYGKTEFSGSEFKKQITKIKKKMSTFGLSKGYIPFLEELHHLIIVAEKSDVEFVRKTSLVFADRNYVLCIITFKRIHELLIKATLFSNQINGVKSYGRIY